MIGLICSMTLALTRTFLLGAAGLAGWYYLGVAVRPDFEKVGGTVLVYQVDRATAAPGGAGYRPENLAAALERRLDPTGSLNISVRPRGTDEVEIRIPRAGADYRDRVQRFKRMIAQAGVLEFRILANLSDDSDGIAAAERFLADPKNKQALEKAARQALPPPPPPPPDPRGFRTTRMDDLGRHTYSWVELGRSMRLEMGLDNAAERNPDRNELWKRAARARDEGKALELTGIPFNGLLLYSRKVQDPSLRDREPDKKYEYFLLTRDPHPGEAVTGAYLVSANEATDSTGHPTVRFRLNKKGGDLFRELTSQNLPGTASEETFRRSLALILDGQILSAPRVNAAISADGEINGRFTREEVSNLVTILRSGALPIALKPVPVRETEVQPGE